MNRTLVDRALAKASECEKKGDKAGVDRWMKVADEAEQAYDRIDESNAKLRAEGKIS
jgi:hypothetical protein